MAVSIGFLLFGMTAGTFLPRLSAIKENRGLTDGQVGVVFLMFAVGAVISAGAGRWILARGARTPVRAQSVEPVASWGRSCWQPLSSSGL